MYLVNDLFAGGGGSITGAEMVEGVKTQWAANHLDIAIETLKQNHPGVQPVLQDLMQADFFKMPPCFVLSASPECRGHAKSRGKEKARHDASRSTAYAPLAAIDALYHRKKLPKVLLIENVPEFRDWVAYGAWKFSFESYGYRFTELVLNAADFGAPMNRERLVLVGVQGRRALDLPDSIWPRERHVPAIEHLRWDEGRWNPIDPEGRRAVGLKPLKSATLAQIEHGKRTYGDRFLLRYNGAQRDRDQVAQSPFQPIGSLTTKPRFGVVKVVRGETWVRMMSLLESKTAIGFPAGYWLPKKLEDGHKLIGNAVSPPVMKTVLERVLERVA